MLAVYGGDGVIYIIRRAPGVVPGGHFSRRCEIEGHRWLKWAGRLRHNQRIGSGKHRCRGAETLMGDKSPKNTAKTSKQKGAKTSAPKASPKK
jgi:hypothetical protein